MICERCHIGRMQQLGLDSDAMYEHIVQECECCTAVIIAEHICDLAEIR